MLTSQKRVLIGKWTAIILIASFTVATNFVFDDFIEDGGSMAIWVLLTPTLVGLYYQSFNKRLLPFILTYDSIRNIHLSILGILSLAPTALGKFIVRANKGDAYYSNDGMDLLIQDFIPFVSAFLAIVALIILLSRMEDAADFIKSGSNLAEISIITISVVFVVALQTTFYHEDMRHFSVSNINRSIYVLTSVAYVYCSFTAMWHTLRKVIFNIKNNTKWTLDGKYQFLPWIILIYPLTCIYSLNMYIWFNLFAVMITPILMLGSYLAFDYVNKSLPIICGVIFSILYIIVGLNSSAMEQSPLLIGLTGIVILAVAIVIAIVIKPLHLREMFTCSSADSDKNKSKNCAYYLITIYVVMAIVVLFTPPRQLDRDWINQYRDVTSEYVDQMITIQSCARAGSYNHYISTDFDDKELPIRANRILPGSWEKFEVKRSELSEEDKVYINLRPIESPGRYITVRLDKNPSPLKVESYAPRDWESFRVLEKDGWKYIVTMNYDIFLTVSNDKASNPVEARSDINKPGTWEQFAISIVDSNQGNVCDDIQHEN